MAGRQLPLGGADLPAGQPAAGRAAAARARQAAPFGPLGHHPGAELRLRAPEPGHRPRGPGRHLRDRARARRPGPGGERLPGGHLQRGLPPHRPGHRGAAAAVPPIFLPGRHPQPRRPRDPRVDQRGRRARLLPWSTPTGPPSTTPSCWCAAWSATGRPRPGPWPPAGTPTSSSARPPTGRSCRSCTSTATRSPTRPSWPASPKASCGPCWRATGTPRGSSQDPSRRPCTSGWPRSWTRWWPRSAPSSAGPGPAGTAAGPGGR